MSEALPNYGKVRADLIVALAEDAVAGKTGTPDLEKYLADRGIPCPRGWADQLARDLQVSGLGHGTFSPFAVSFKAGGQCIEQAEFIRSSRTFIGRLKKLPLGLAGWDLFKIGLGAALGGAATKIFGT